MMLEVTEDQYIYPPRPKTAMPFEDVEFFAEIGWGWQYKVNDSRCLIKYLPDGSVELWNRHAERFRSYNLPDWLEDQLVATKKALGLVDGELHILDGGLLDQKHAAIKDTIVIWDILVRSGKHLLGTTCLERFNSIAVGTTDFKFSHESYEAPIKFGRNYDGSPNVFHLEWNPDGDLASAWQTVQNVNKPYTNGKPGCSDYSIKPILEGLVLKDGQGPLEMGMVERNNGSWMCRSRVTTGRHQF